MFSFGISLFMMATRALPKLGDKAYESRESFVEAVCKGERPKVGMCLFCKKIIFNFKQAPPPQVMTNSLKTLIQWCWLGCLMSFCCKTYKKKQREALPSRRPTSNEVVERLDTLLIEVRVKLLFVMGV